MIALWTPITSRSRVISIVQSGSDVGAVVAMMASGVLADSTFLGGWPSIFYVFGECLRVTGDGTFASTVFRCFLSFLLQFSDTFSRWVYLQFGRYGKGRKEKNQAGCLLSQGIKSYWLVVADLLQHNA